MRLDDRTRAGHRAGIGTRLWISLLFALALSWLAGTNAAFAHDPGLSTATIQLKPGRLEAELAFAIADAGQVITLRTNAGGQLSTAELSAAAAKLQTAAEQALEVRFDDVLSKAAAVRCEF